MSKASSVPTGRNDSGRRNVSRQSPAYSRRAFEGLILRAANVVFATTNSGEIERLIDERGQFDWSIVEEAGKATGSELLSPLLLSHRRLMIGDHKQLPPYRSDEMKKLLEDPDGIRNVVKLAGDLISRSLRDADMEELLDEIEAEEADLAPLCADAINTMMLFETLVEKEFARQAVSSLGRPIARRLAIQHRMHPAIARIVSHCFYDDGLSTDTKREATSLLVLLPALAPMRNDYLRRRSLLSTCPIFRNKWGSEGAINGHHRVIPRKLRLLSTHCLCCGHI